MKNYKKIKLVLEDKSEFEGYSFGYEGSSNGEVVFNTGMVGYEECLTDPSYYGQILVLTYPLIGNYGVDNNFESKGIKVKGLIVSSYINEYSHSDAQKSLSQWLRSEKIPAIFGIDTRSLTKKLRERGVMLGKIFFHNKEIDFVNYNENNLAAEVSIKKPKIYGKGKKEIILVDCGYKKSILDNFIKRGIKIRVVPWDYDYLKDEYDGIFISNGPGDPEKCDKTIYYLKKALSQNKPIFGICLGSQIMGLAAGAETYKLKYGHRSQNQPCIEVGTKKCYLTSQNHGYAIKENSMPLNWQIMFTNINDETIEGIKHKTKPFFSVQFHPEVHPGPDDTGFLFDDFIKLL